MCLAIDDSCVLGMRSYGTLFITDCSPIGWLQSVLKIKSFENLFIYFLNFFQSSRLGMRLGGGLDHLFHPPSHLLYPGTNSTYEVPVLGEFTYTPVWTILDFGQT